MADDWSFTVESSAPTDGYWKIIIRTPEDVAQERDGHGPVLSVDGNTFTFAYVAHGTSDGRDEWNSGVPSARDFEFDLRVTVDDGRRHREVVPVKGSGGGGPGGSTDAKRQKPRFIRSK